MAARTKVAVREKRTERREGPSLFAPSPLIEGEDGTAYNELLATMCAAIKPKDILEEMRMREAVDQMWETQHWRRLKAAFLTSIRLEGIHNILEGLLGEAELGRFLKQWATHDEQAVKQLEEWLASLGLTMDIVVARTMSSNANIKRIKHFDQMIVNAEARRDAALGKIERHRASAPALRRENHEVIDAEFEDVAQIQRAPRNVTWSAPVIATQDRRRSVGQNVQTSSRSQARRVFGPGHPPRRGPGGL